MSRPSALPALRRLQRRFSFVLTAALCLWMLAVASHFHTEDQDSHQGTHALCAFCVSVPSSGAAPVVVVFIAAPQSHVLLPTVEILPVVTAPAIARYYSRGPPLV